MGDSDKQQVPSGPTTVTRDRVRAAIVFFLGVAVVVLYFGGYLRFPDPLEGTPAKAFTLSSLDGRKVNVAEHFGRDVVLLDFWATWCPPCRRSLPALGAIAGEFASSGLVVYAVNQQDTPEAVRNFLQSENIDVPVLLDSDSFAGGRYGVTGIPKIVLIDRGGTIVFVHSGFGPGTERIVRGAVRKALE